jgi:inosose dehydratase
MTIHIGNAPVSWGIFEFTGLTPKYTYEQVLDEIRDAGYKGTELGPWGYLPTDPARLREELDKRDLKMLSAFVPIKLIDPGALKAGEEVALRTGALLHALGAKIIVLADDNLTVQNRIDRSGRIRPEDSLTAEQWKTFAANVNKVAQSVMDKYGMSMAFHHHCGGYVETPAEIDRLMELTRPELVGLCLDTGHYVYGGGSADGVEAVKKYGSRINHLHFKDCDPAVLARSRREGLNYLDTVGAGIFCELGKGSVNFRAIADEMNTLGYEGFAVVEQDILPGLGTPLESARRNREYLRSIGL